jgi:hypothetical protein
MDWLAANRVRRRYPPSPGWSQQPAAGRGAAQKEFSLVAEDQQLDDPPEELNLETSWPVPLPRDPPPPPGYVNPVEENALLEDPFTPREGPGAVTES